MAILTKATVKLFLQVGHDTDDDLIDIAIDAWQEWLEQELGITFYSSSGAVVEYCDGGLRSLRPDQLPINSVTKVEDHENDDSEYSSDDYQYTKRRIELEASTTTWGAGTKRWKVTYNGGYDEADVPAGIQTILLDLIYGWYWGRGARTQSTGGVCNYSWKEEQFVQGSIGYRMKRYSMLLSIG